MINMHITENTFEKYILAPDELNEREKKNVETHLDECALCKESYAKLRDFHTAIEENLRTELTERDKIFAQKLFCWRKQVIPFRRPELAQRSQDAIDTYFEIIEPYRRPLAQRFIRYIQIHPIRVASGVSLAAALVFATLLIRPMFKDTNPSYARAKDEFLVVYNKEGEELWRKHIGMGFDSQQLLRNLGFEALDNSVTTADVDNNGTNEVIAVFGWLPQPPSGKKNAVTCYSSDGSERWTYEFNRKITFGSEEFSNDYRLVTMTVGDFDKNGSVEIVAIAQHIPYYPCAVVRLDANKGILLNEYWHPGVIPRVFSADMDGDGIDELIFGGTSNGFNGSSLLVLDTRMMSGHAPSPPAYTPVGIEKGTEKYYILLPQSDLCKVGPGRRNGVYDLRLTTEHLLEVHTFEVQAEWNPPGLLYYFNTQMSCIRVDANDYFVQEHEKMKKEGKLIKVLDKQYFEELRQSVQYWDGEKFVNEPTMNRKYSESKKNLP
jgi:hypothetical protein